MMRFSEYEDGKYVNSPEKHHVPLPAYGREHRVPAYGHEHHVPLPAYGHGHEHQHHVPHPAYGHGHEHHVPHPVKYHEHQVPEMVKYHEPERVRHHESHFPEVHKKVHFVEKITEIDCDGKREVIETSIDMEADDYIQQRHKKFDTCNGGSFKAH